MLKDMTGSFNTAIVVAAGSGSRLTSEIPKQFLKLRGLEILAYSVQAFLAHPKINEVIIVTSKHYLEHVAREYPNCQIVPGGETRQDSVFNGLSACSANTDIVLVHDAARPLIPARVIDECLFRLQTLDGVAPAVRPVDSMVEIGETSFRNLQRDSLRIIQTPQCFHFNILRDAHDSGKIDTDEMGLVKQSNPKARLGFVDGAPETIKVTRSIDLDIVEMFLRNQEKA
ncbi:MAG: 2-C-methyl-D-erythritol 4-phosphate cytidylyltransferase [Candidatus Marinimicrobia bacterium]|nr:2-C-methyl-D-erythritol 4-phosphate cytidylyltransferase [Candidatus Neomarinimicrobiota bacterium]MCF7921451.1 2-C-methyl-D-erythritol 4-phosphate cytidylyltransferase [Candidatus Neomarinimicrobiota bacterium]